MSAEDMAAFGIDAETSDYENPAVRRSFWRILDVAAKECGFAVSGDKLLIQFYPNGSGSELFVTKLGKIGSAERNISKSRNVAMLTSKYSIYRFECAGDLFALLHRIKNGIKDLRYDGYLCDDGWVYLIIEERSVSGQLSDYAVISEYGTELSNAMIPYVVEHSERLPKKGALIHS